MRAAVQLVGLLHVRASPRPRGVGPGDTSYRSASPSPSPSRGGEALRAGLQRFQRRSDNVFPRRRPSQPLAGRCGGQLPRRVVREASRSRSPLLRSSRHLERPATSVPSRETGSEARLEALLSSFGTVVQDLSGQVAQLAQAQVENSRKPLSRPLLAAVDAVLADSRPGSAREKDTVEQLRRILRLADGLQDPDETVAAVLPLIWKELQYHPDASDNALLSGALDELPLGRSVQSRSLSAPSLLRAVPSVKLAACLPVARTSKQTYVQLAYTKVVCTEGMCMLT